MPKNAESAKTVAEKQLAQEEEARRESRLAELQQEEEGRRQQEARDREREEARLQALEEIHRLAGERLKLEKQAEEQAAALVQTLQELEPIDAEQRQAVAAAGETVPNTPHAAMIHRWLYGALKPAAKNLGHDLFEGKPLSERDPLSPEGEGSRLLVSPEQRAREQEEAERESADRDAERKERIRAGQARKNLEALEKRHERMCHEYKRPVEFDELVKGEKERIENLLTAEELETFKADIDGRA